MGAGRGKVVEIKNQRHNLVANSDFANMNEVTQYHDHDEYLKLTDKQFRDFKLGRVTPTLKREGILEIMKGEVFENNRDRTRDVLDNVRSAGDAYAEALNTVRTLNKIKDTVYKYEILDIEIDNNVFIPLNVINELKRKAFEELNNKRLYKIPYKKCEYKIDVKSYPKERLLNILIDKNEDINILKKKYDYI